MGRAIGRAPSTTICLITVCVYVARRKYNIATTGAVDQEFWGGVWYLPSPSSATAKPDLAAAIPDLAVAKPDLAAAKPDLAAAKPEFGSCQARIGGVGGGY